MIVLKASDVRAALPMVDAVEAMRWALAAWSSGQAIIPQRLHLDLPDESGVGLVMPAYVAPREGGAEGAAYAVKVFSGIKANPKRGLAVFEGATMLLDPETSRCLAVMDAGALTGIRTGACAGVATDLLARPDASSLALIGAGVQGRAMVEAVCLLRRIESIRIYDKRPERAKRLCYELAGLAASVTQSETVSAAARGADVVCTATSSTAPVFLPEDVQEGAHINAIGSFRADMMEIPGATVAAARVFADNASVASVESGDLVQPLREGLIGEDHIVGEIGDILLGRVVGREDDEQTTIYKSVGIAAQDAVAALAAYKNALAKGIGQIVDW